jgi:hypothetical protein
VQVCVKQKVKQGHKKSEGKVVNGKILYFQVSRQRYPAPAVPRSFVFLVAFAFVFVFIVIAEEIEENGEEKDKFKVGAG